MNTTTNTVAAIQEKQAVALEAIYDTISGTPESVAASKEYDATVSQLTALLGENACCSQIDMDKWQLYSDGMKDANGFRPRGHTTVAEVDAWFHSMKDVILD